jgi:pyrroline-5-carboxylate reductase
MKIAFIGGGNMAEAMIAGILQAKFCLPQDLTVYDISQSRCSFLRENYKVNIAESNPQAVKEGEVVILAIKPADLPAVMRELKGLPQPEQVILSIVAGASLSALKEGLGHHAIVRVMPNINAKVREAVCLWTATPEVNPEQKGRTRLLLQALGREIYMENEKLLNMATAVSGSGPAYIFLFIEALTDAAVHLGLGRELAQEIVLQTFIGSAKAVQILGQHPAELRNLVASPGGTTVEGLLHLEQAGIRAAITQAILAAHDKAKRLG